MRTCRCGHTPTTAPRTNAPPPPSKNPTHRHTRSAHQAALDAGLEPALHLPRLERRPVDAPEERVALDGGAALGPAAQALRRVALQQRLEQRQRARRPGGGGAARGCWWWVAAAASACAGRGCVSVSGAARKAAGTARAREQHTPARGAARHSQELGELGLAGQDLLLQQVARLGAERRDACAACATCVRRVCDVCVCVCARVTCEGAVGAGVWMHVRVCVSGGCCVLCGGDSGVVGAPWRARARTHTHTHTHAGTHTHTYTCRHTHTHAGTHTHKHMQAHTHTHTCRHTCTHARARCASQQCVPSPASISYSSTPHDHQSTARPWPAPATISGAMYSIVPMKLFVLCAARRVWDAGRGRRVQRSARACSKGACTHGTVHTGHAAVMPAARHLLSPAMLPLANPKSVRRTWPSPSSSTFSGLRSLVVRHWCWRVCVCGRWRCVLDAAVCVCVIGV
jgi:hypothetical protein